MRRKFDLLLRCGRDLISDQFNSYTYDGEGRIVSVVPGMGTAATYSYDAQGHRVISVTGGHTWSYRYDLSSRISWEFQDATWYRGEVYGPKGRLATYKNSLTYFPTQDLVRTVRNNTTQDMGSLESCYSLPFGDGQGCWGNALGGPAPAFFTGKERDSESGLDMSGLGTTPLRWGAS